MTATASPADDQLALQSTGITSPIRLLAYFGAVVSGIVASLSFGMAKVNAPTTAVVALAFTAGALPLAWLVVIYLLIARHHTKLYSPREFLQPDEFIRVVALDRNVTSFGSQTQYEPFVLADATNEHDLGKVRQVVQNWSPILRSVHADEFLVLHAWYNERDQHALALLCLDIAIATGSLGSKNYSFRSASLRKLGRLKEAAASASLALTVDPRNVDAHYNLAKTLLETGDETGAWKHARLAASEQVYAERLADLFPGLTPA